MKLFLKADRLMFAREIEVDDKDILLNDVILPDEFNPHNVRLWVIGNEFGTCGAVWASNETDALDELIDAGKGDGLLVDDTEENQEREDFSRHGNGGELCDLSYAWMQEVEFIPARDWKNLIEIARAAGACQTTLFS